MINSRDIKLLKPYVQYLCKKLIEECKKQGINILITSTVRDQEYQSSLYAQGRTRSGNIVTNAKYIGAHGFGLAFDVVPLVNGKPVWNNTALWNKIGQIGMSIGLEWGGSWRTISDKPHFQYVRGLSDSQLRAGKLPVFPPIPQSKPTINDEKDGINIMDYDLKPIARGKLFNTTTLECCSAPSNKARTGVILRKMHEPFNIYARAYNQEEKTEWVLININPKCIQWVASSGVQLVL